MVRWIRRPKRPLRPARGLPSVEDATDDGVRLAEYATRMSIKNLIEVRVLAEGDSFDASLFVDETREAMLAMIGELQASAERVDDEVKAAVMSSGRPIHEHDYGLIDRPNLRHRSSTYLSVAERLRELMEDERYLRGLVELARDDAWEEIGGAIIASAGSGSTVMESDPGYQADLLLRQQELAMDLAELERVQRRQAR